MKKWIKRLWISAILFVAIPLTVGAAEDRNIFKVKDTEVSVYAEIPEGKTGVITSLNMKLCVSADSGLMDAPTFSFDSAIKSEVKDAAVTRQKDGTYLVDLILCGKKDKNIFGDSESVKLGTLSLRPTTGEYKIYVEADGSQERDGSPVVKYMDANGITVMAAPLTHAQPVSVKSADSQVLRETPKLSASVKGGSRTVSFSWKKIAGADGYEIFEVNGKKQTRIKSVAGTVVTASKAYGYATTHSFKIRAFQKNKDGSKTYGSFSKVVRVTLGPDKVKGFSVRYKSASKVSLTWKKTKGANGYTVYRSTKKNGKYAKVKNIQKGTSVSCTLKHPSGKTYYYKIRAYYRKSGKTISGSLGTAVLAKTHAPKLKGSVKGRNVTMSWKKVPQADGYRVYRCRTKSGKYRLVKTLKKASQTSYTEKLPGSSKVWYYKVCAFEKKGKQTIKGSYSSTIKAKAK